MYQIIFTGVNDNTYSGQYPYKGELGSPMWALGSGSGIHTQPFIKGQHSLACDATRLATSGITFAPEAGRNPGTEAFAIWFSFVAEDLLAKGAIASLAGDQQQSWFFDLTTLGELRFNYQTGDGTSSGIKTLSLFSGISVNKLVEVALLRQGSTLRAYVRYDGAAQPAILASDAATNWFASTAPVTLGRLNVTGYEFPFSGHIDEFKYSIGDVYDFTSAAAAFPKRSFGVGDTWTAVVPHTQVIFTGTNTATSRDDLGNLFELTGNCQLSGTGSPYGSYSYEGLEGANTQTGLRFADKTLGVFGSQDFSIEVAFVYNGFSGNGGQANIVGKSWDAKESFGLTLVFGKPYFNPGDQTSCILHPTAVPVGAKCRLALSKSGTTLKSQLEIDGTAYSVVTQNVSMVIPINDAPLTIGNHTYANWIGRFIGRIDELKIAIGSTLPLGAGYAFPTSSFGDSDPWGNSIVYGDAKLLVSRDGRHQQVQTGDLLDKPSRDLIADIAAQASSVTFTTLSGNHSAKDGVISYDANGRLATIEFPGLTKLFSYNADGTLHSITLSGGLVPANVAHTKTFSYANGKLSGFSFS